MEKGNSNTPQDKNIDDANLLAAPEGNESSRPKRTRIQPNRPGFISWDDFSDVITTVQEDDEETGQPRTADIEESTKRSFPVQPSTSTALEWNETSRPKRLRAPPKRPGFVSWDDFSNFCTNVQYDKEETVTKVVEETRRRSIDVEPSSSQASTSSNNQSSRPKRARAPLIRPEFISWDEFSNAATIVQNNKEENSKEMKVDIEEIRKRSIPVQPSSTAPTLEGNEFSRPKRFRAPPKRPGFVSWGDFSHVNNPMEVSRKEVALPPILSCRRLLSASSLPSTSSSSPASSNIDDEEMDMPHDQSVQQGLTSEADNNQPSTSGTRPIRNRATSRDENASSGERAASRTTSLRSWNYAKFTPSALASFSSVCSSSFPSPSASHSGSTPRKSRATKSKKEASIVFGGGQGGYILNSASLQNSTFEAPIMVVECWNAEDLPENIDTRRIKVVREFKWEIPSVCDAARRNAEDGLWKKGCPFPGNPKAKYTDEQYEEFGDQEQYWTAQTLFTREDCRERLSVLYEGWATVFDQGVDDMKKGAPEAYEIFKIRDNFLKKIKKSGPEWARSIAEQQRVLKKEKKLLYLNHDNHFWLCQDLSYFHTVHHKEHRLGPIFYIGLEELTSPPKFLYSAVNVLKATTYRRMMEMKANLQFSELCKMTSPKQLKRVKDDDKGSCENKEHCVCNKRFQLLYSHAAQHLQPDAHGKLDFSNFNSNASRIVVECSDECGCTAKCPRRALQRGQQKPLVIFFEGVEAWGIRAAADIEGGSLVCEYTGQGFYKADEKEERTSEKVKKPDDDIAHPTKETSYECDFSVMDTRLILCAGKIGNVARFLNHNCDPNCVFVETHSRQLESDVLVPRVAVYALRDIKMGEAVCISYWGDVSKLKFIPSQKECECGAAKCIKFLPSKIL